MNKYIVYRMLGEEDEPDRKKELVAVEYGKSINDVTPALIRDINADLAGMPEYAGFQTAAFEPLSTCKYQNRYPMQGIVMPPKADENILIDFEIEEMLAQPNEYLSV
jgi:hypothetical protein